MIQVKKSMCPSQCGVKLEINNRHNFGKISKYYNLPNIPKSLMDQRVNQKGT